MNNRTKYQRAERIGTMSQQAEIHSYTETVADSGYRSQNWQLLDTVWTAVTYQYLRSKEVELAGQETVRQSVQFRIRTRNDINETQRVYFQGRLYDIEAIGYSNDRLYATLTCRQYDAGEYITPEGSGSLGELLYLQSFTGETGDTVTVTVYGGNIPSNKARVWVSLNGQEITPYSIAGNQIVLDFSLE